MSEKLPLRAKFAYAAPAVVLAMMGVPFYVFIPKFYTDTVGISATLMGWIILLSRIWDALLDPFLGQLSDRTVHPLGRRRSWIVLGTPLLALCFYLLLVPPASWSTPALSVWAAVFIFLFFVGWTFVSLPYQALGNELSSDSDDRTKILGMRDGGLVLGTLLAILVPYFVSQYTGDRSHDEGERWQNFVLALLYGLFLVLTAGWCCLMVREPRLPVSAVPEGTLFSNFRSMLKNRPFVVLLIAYTIGGLGSQLPAGMFMYYVEYVLTGSKQQGYQFLLLYFVLGFAFLPLWIWLATKFNKRDVWLSAMVINTGSFVGVLFLDPGDIASFGVIVTFSGIGYGAVLAVPSSMQGDVIDYDEYQTGKRREGQFMGLWLVANKLSGALGAGFGQMILGAYGYIPNQPQTAEVQWAITVLYGGIPCACYACAMFVALWYPLTRGAFAKVRAELDQRKATLCP